MTVLRSIDGFFFRQIPATCFGLMRIFWAGITMLYLLFQWKDVAYYYSERGILPRALEDMFVRTDLRLTLLDFVTQPLAVHCLYLVLIVLLFCMMIGLRTRETTILSVILLFGFHERNPFVLGGGDTLLRTIGFILMIAPGITALSVDRAGAGWGNWKKNRTLQPPVMMPIWPWRLLLWQMIVLYATSTWTKLLGTMWMDGTAIQTTLHHPLFARFPSWTMDPFMPMLPIVDWLALIYQALWILLLVPHSLTDLLPKHVQHIPLRRLLIIGGILFHGGIFLLMDAGVFSLAVFVAYIGLLRENDIAWLKKILSRIPNTIVVLFDSHCGLCISSMYLLRLCDWIKILKPVDFRDEIKRKKYAPNLKLKDLDLSMHILIPKHTQFPISNTQYSVVKGFDAFRYMTGKLPPLWPLYPLLWIPGVAPMGRRVYARIADSRKKCNHENCAI